MRVFQILLLLLLAPLSGWGAITDQPTQSGAAGTYENLQVVCKTLMLAGPQGNIADLARFYPLTTNTDIREAITAANGLYWMMNQHIADAERYAEHLHKNFPNSRYNLLLDKDANLLACSNCVGSGVAPVPCPDCGGTGKCRNCGGRGKVAGIVSGNTTLNSGPTLAGPGAVGGGITRTVGAGGITRLGDPQSTGIRPMIDSSQQPCAMCGGSGTCKSCKGTKLVKGRCPFCQGAGTVFTPQTRLAYVDVLNHLRNLAFAAGQAERNLVLLDGRWLDQTAGSEILQRRSVEHADFVRVTAEAEQAKDYKTALLLLDNVLARHSDSIYTADVQRVRALVRADSTNKKLPEKSQRSAEQMAAINNNPRREIGVILDAVLEAARRGTNMPMLIASNAVPVLPVKPLKWQIGEPELIDRTARIPVRIDRASRSGFPVSEPWEFHLVFENIQWKIWQTTGP